MNRFCAAADQTPNAFGGWFEHVREFEEVRRKQKACTSSHVAKPLTFLPPPTHFPASSYSLSCLFPLTLLPLLLTTVTY